MDLQITGIKNRLIEGEVQISGSKSESNRLLILQQLFPKLTIQNLSDSDDTNHMIEALNSDETEINIGHAGTAMRFLTAYFASQEDKTVVLSGSDRMHNRPIKILVDALRSLGAEIDYVEKQGYPPLKISGTKFVTNRVKINGNVSSQYISALLLIAPKLPNGLIIELEADVTSIPYIKMTLGLLNQIGVKTSFNEQIIKVEPLNELKSQTVVVESDWSSASYFYSIVALSEVGSEITLSAYKEKSLQGDSVLATIYQHFGVETLFGENTITLKKLNVISSGVEKSPLEVDLIKAPDIAQTIAVTCFGLGIACNLTGLHTLKIKETDRLEALEAELTKLGADISVTNESLHLEGSLKINSYIEIETYNDHRMAMAFAPLGMLEEITILDSEVVTKSYRCFWSDLEKIGFQFQEF